MFHTPPRLMDDAALEEQRLRPDNVAEDVSANEVNYNLSPEQAQHNIDALDIVSAIKTCAVWLTPDSNSFFLEKHNTLLEVFRMEGIRMTFSSTRTVVHSGDCGISLNGMSCYQHGVYCQ